MRRVVITGVGALSAGGLSAVSTWEAVRDARMLLVPPSHPGERRTGVRAVAEVPTFEPEALFDRRRLSALDRVSQLAILAAREAVAQSGLAIDSLPPDRGLCVVGTGAGGEITRDVLSERVYARGEKRVPPLTVPRIMVSAVASQLAIELGVRGGVFVMSSACASATHAIGYAFQALRGGMADVAITGGSEACLSFGGLMCWEAMHVLSDDLCRPFSKGRRGLVLGEGAAILVLEEREAALRRGAEILAEITGFGMSSDAGSLTAPDPEGMARAMRIALADARGAPETIDHVNAHGTGTYANDVSECAALGLVFGARAAQLPVTANKSVLGHALGASGALELAMAVMSLREQVLAPTANFAEPDPECPIDCVPNVARDARLRRVLSNSFAFGGLNACLVLDRG